MGKSKTRIVFLLTLLSSIFLMTACSGQEPAGDTKETVSPESNVQETEYTVTFYDMDGTTELSTEKVKAGEPVKEHTPEKSGYVFMGWYATPSLSHKFDFTVPIAEDTKIFAGFLEEKEDTRSFAIVGSGKSPLLAASSWGKVIKEEHLLTRGPDKNVYTINLDIYEGDEFQLAMDTSGESGWYNQRGAGYLTATAQDGVEYLSGSGGNYQSNDAKKMNIKCLIAGNYTITLTTYPGADYYDTADSNYTEEGKEKFNYNPYDTITWVYNGETKEPVADIATTYYIKSSVATGWNDIYEDQYKFMETDSGLTLTIELADKEEFLFTSRVKTGDTESVGNEYIRFSNIKDSNSLEYVEGSASDNIIAKAAGIYTFTYDNATTELTVAYEAK